MESKLILLVEDNADDVELTRRAFQKGNVANNLKVVGDGAEALEFFFGTGRYEGRDTSIQPAVVLLDLRLPRLDGIEVLKRIRADERTRLLPVVILTSSKEEIDLINGYKEGANSYIRKPVDFDQFMQAAQQLKLYWLVLNEAPPARRR